MENNDVLRRLRYVFDYSDSKMIGIFRHANRTVTRAELSDWLKRDEDPAYEYCDDVVLASFLNGFIIEKRGKRDGDTPKPEKRLSNNAILMKLKIAMAITSEELLEIMELAEFRISKHELSAFLRRPGHRHYRECLDQFLRNFLNGMKLKYRDKAKIKPGASAQKKDTPKIKSKPRTKPTAKTKAPVKSAPYSAAESSHHVQPKPQPKAAVKAQVEQQPVSTSPTAEQVAARKSFGWTIKKPTQPKDET